MAWEKFKDETGRSYYHNASTGETSWEKPTEYDVKAKKRDKHHHDHDDHDRDHDRDHDHHKKHDKHSRKSEKRSSDHHSHSRKSEKKGHDHGYDRHASERRREKEMENQLHDFVGTKKAHGRYEIFRTPEQHAHPESWPILWLKHIQRCFFGSFMDKKLASRAERKYLGHQLKMDPEDAGETFCLICWRKSVLYVLFSLMCMILVFDLGSVYEEFKYWGYLKEMMTAPQYHAISGLPPYELFDDYMSEVSVFVRVFIRCIRKCIPFCAF